MCLFDIPAGPPPDLTQPNHQNRRTASAVRSVHATPMTSCGGRRIQGRNDVLRRRPRDNITRVDAVLVGIYFSRSRGIEISAGHVRRVVPRVGTARLPAVNRVRVNNIYAPR